MKTVFTVLAIAIVTSFISVEGVDLTRHGEEGYNAQDFLL